MFLGGQKLGEAKMFDFRRITIFCLECRLSKHKMTRYVKNVGGRGHPWLRLWTVYIREPYACGPCISVNRTPVNRTPVKSCEPYACEPYIGYACEP